MMPEERFRVGAVSRWCHALVLGVLVVMTVAMLSGTGLSWVVLVFAALVVLQAVNTLQLWRWEVTTDAAGVTVRNGLANRRHVAWDHVRGVRRTLPPTIEVQGGRDLGLGTAIPRRTLRRVAEHLDARVRKRA